MELRKLKTLVIAMEECGEMIRACSKIIRHGTDDPKYVDNLVHESGDVIAMIRILTELYKIDTSDIENAVQRKLTKFKNADYD